MSNSNNNSSVISNEQRANEPILNLENMYVVNVTQLFNGTRRYTIEQLIAALEVTTTLHHLFPRSNNF
jgi:hypothetical protein